MNPTLAASILVLLEGALFAAPLLPALEELRLKRDAKPLGVIQKHSGDVGHFARGFRDYIGELQQPLQQCVNRGATTTGKLANGEEYLLLGHACEASFTDVAKVKGLACNLVIATGTDMTLPSGLIFLKEIYAAGRLTGGEGNTYRAILGEKDVYLQRASKVKRWAHAAGHFRAGQDCDMYGRLSSDEDILLETGCAFQRVHAPRIAMGCECDRGAPAPEFSSSASRRPSEPLIRRRLIEGDAEIGRGEVIAEDVIARGQLHVATGARMLGSVKGNQKVVVESGAVVEGSLISAGALHIGPRCRIRGPVLAERQIEIGSGTICGAADSLTTVSSPVIEVEEGTLFFGTLWARDEGRVLPKG